MSEQYGSSKQIIRNTIALGATRGLERVTTFVVSFFVARELGASGLGVYSAAIAYFSVISVAAEMGAPNYLIREIAKCRDLTSRYLVHLTVMAALPCCLAIVAAFLIVPHLHYSDDLAASVKIVVAAAMAGIVKTIQEAVFVAHQKVEFVAYSTILSALSGMVVSVLLLHKGYGIVSLIGAFAAMQYFVVACYFALLNCFVSRVRWEFKFRTAIQLSKDIKIFAASSILSALAGRPEIIILSALTDDAHIGFYSAALRITEAWSIIPETYMTNVYSVLSHAFHVGDWDRLRLIVQKSAKYLLALSLPLSVGIAVCARPIISTVYGSGFEESVPLLQTLACCVPIATLTGVFWRLLAAKDQQNLMFNAQVVTTIARLLFGFSLVAWLSDFGAALSTTLTTLLFNVLLALYVRRDGTRLGVLNLAWRNALAAAGMGVATTVIISRVPLWLTIPCSVILYGGLVILVKGISSEDLGQFRRLLPSWVQG